LKQVKEIMDDLDVCPQLGEMYGRIKSPLELTKKIGNIIWSK